MNKPKIKLIVAAVAALVAEVVAPSLSGVAHAAPPQFTQAWVRPDTHKALTLTGVMICATPSAATTGVTESLVKITFPTDAGATDFAVNATASNWTVDTTNIPATATAWPSIGTATVVSGHTVTFPSGDLTAATQYCFHTAARLTNGTAVTSTQITGATLITYDSAGTPAPVNRTNWSTAVITDDTITVSAVVPPNFTITLTGNADTFTTNLDPTAIISTTGIDVGVNTNAVGGWIAWIKSINAGLTSAAAGYTIASGLKNTSLAQTKFVGNPAFDLIVGQEGYVVDVDLKTQGPNSVGAGGCVDHIDAAYNSGSGVGGGVLDTNFQPINACTRDWAPKPGTSDGDVLTLVERATIRGGTPAGSDYSDIITVVGAGNF